MNNNIFDQILGVFNKLSIQQRLIIGGATVGTFVLIIILVFFLNEPLYTTLYTNLAEEDASKVIEQLTSQKIPYVIEDNGKTIKVPKEKVYETRLTLAGKGIPNSGIIGYEIFDKTTMGMSEFMQKLNYKRALEGELSKTIMGQDGVEAVRVHIVLPPKSIFREEEKLPTASVVLKMKNNYNLTKTNIAAIVNLVSSSVEGLLPNKITLLDTRGRLLSKETDENPLANSSSKQYEIKQQVENYLVQKAQGMLDNVLGYGNAMVQVNAEINFDQVEKTMETYDPESQVAISEQSIKTENNGKNMSDSSAQTNQNSTTNYEISKTIQKVIEGSGNIKRMSVAAVINDVQKEVKKGDQVQFINEPQSPEQLKKLEEIIKNATGFDLNRQDQLSVVNINFQPKTFEDIKVEKSSFFDNPEKWINVLFVLGGIIASLFILKGLMQRLKNEKIIIGTINQDNMAFETGGAASLLRNDGTKSIPTRKKNILPVGDIEDEISDDAINKRAQQEKITNYVAKNPVDAAKLINAWLHEDE
ncbi:MAG: flagellar M-ring protein FliF [Ignavibacteriaceae bacterium]|jgi:flagellar M-ring protein FliF|nr:flagellar M-ring protein FliF [Ignavibacteriaceae bacterium]